MFKRICVLLSFVFVLSCATTEPSSHDPSLDLDITQKESVVLGNQLYWEVVIENKSQTRSYEDLIVQCSFYSDKTESFTEVYRTTKHVPPLPSQTSKEVSEQKTIDRDIAPALTDYECHVYRQNLDFIL